MKPRELVGTAKVPGGVELRLLRHGDDHIIMVDNNELMNSRVGGSEEALAVMTCERLRKGADPHLLIGGYGMGFTLRAALAILGKGARVTVAELVPEIIDWARTHMSALTAGGLDDPRVHLVAGDVAAQIGAAPRRYDAILLDVDNGPDPFVQNRNERLYAKPGIVRIKNALHPGGRVIFWSAHPDKSFARSLEGLFKNVECISAKAYPKAKRFSHTLFVADRE